MASTILERKLYGGLIHLRHDPNARGRTPRYVVTDTTTGEVTKPRGVTSILGATLAKDLMQWAADSACEYLRAKLPVITEQDLVAAAKEYTVKRDAGGSTGSEAHAMVERFLKNLDTNETVTYSGSEEAKNAFFAFTKWFKDVNPEVINVEEVIYSQDFKYAGTYDCMLKIDGKVYLCDLKTTNVSRKAPNGVYAENFIQLGAYAAAHEEQRLVDKELPGIEGLMVISAKKNGKLDIVTESDLGLNLEDCMTMFKRVNNLYQFMSYTTTQLGGK